MPASSASSGNKAIAVTTDVTPRYVEADPFEGGKQAVAECWRNLTGVGAEPIAVTDNLNFGNPERPEIMGQFVKAIKGIGEACRALDFPVVSGNVSLYNETNGQAILPTPAIGGVGLLPDLSKMTTIAFKAGGRRDHADRRPWHAISASRSICARSWAARKGRRRRSIWPARSAMATSFEISSIARQVTAVHDISDGGLVVAVVEMALASGLGASSRRARPCRALRRGPGPLRGDLPRRRSRQDHHPGPCEGRAT